MTDRPRYSDLWQSPNFGERAGGVQPSLIILHYTGMKTGFSALSRLVDMHSKVSAHYCVDEDGTVYTLLPEDKRAWHAGKSYWAGEADINSHSIGIEIVNPGHEFGYRPFPPVQVQAVIALCRDIQGRYDIRHVLAHSDIAPERKEDPGELFPWKTLAEAGVGLWPSLHTPPLQTGGRTGGGVQGTLTALGYDPKVDEKTLLTAFQRHFVPEAFQNGTQGQADALTLSRLYGLHKLLHP